MKTLIIFFLLFFSQLLHSLEILSPQEFTEEYIHILKKKNSTTKILTFKTLYVKLSINGGNEQESYLDNAYIDYKNNPSELSGILNQYAHSMITSIIDKEKSINKHQIFPVLKDYLYIQDTVHMLDEKNAPKESYFYYEKINAILYLLYVQDTETSMSFLNSDQINDLNIEKEGLLKLSKQNLSRLLSKLEIRGDVTRLSMLSLDGNYEASLLLFDALWNKKQFPVNGNIVVFVPSRDTVLITGSKDKESLTKIDQIMHSPDYSWSHIVTEVGFIRKDNEWQVFKQ